MSDVPVIYTPSGALLKHGGTGSLHAFNGVRTNGLANNRPQARTAKTPPTKTGGAGAICVPRRTE